VKIDIHQHFWTDPLVEALAERDELPFVRREQGLTVLFLSGERPYVIEREDEDAARRAALVRADGLDRALVSLSSPLGIESLPRPGATKLIEAYLEGALALGEPFGVWAPVALDRAAPADVDRALDRGCAGISLPAGALGSVEALAKLSATLGRIQERDAPLFVHPGPGSRLPAQEATLGDPLWWPALTRYVAEVHAAWFVFVTAARRQFPRLRVVFAMLAGLAPLHTERLLARGGPAVDLEDPLIFYDTSCNGPYAISLMDRLVGGEQLVYGSDRPVVDPGKHGVREVSDWQRLARNAGRLVGAEPAGQGGERRTKALSAAASPRRVAVLERALR